MDGNRRFAKKHNKPSRFGHEKGVETLKLICKHAQKQNISFLTLFAFSTENWKRKKSEIDDLNFLLNKFLTSETNYFVNHKIKVVIIGNKNDYSLNVQEKMLNLEQNTGKFTDFTLCIALNYGGKAEILKAVNQALNFNKKELEINEFEDFLDTKDLPDVDLLIRTGGSQRISNFLLWKLAYSELYFTNILWPEFVEKDFDDAIDFWKSQNRNFGS